MSTLWSLWITAAWLFLVSMITLALLSTPAHGTTYCDTQERSGRVITYCADSDSKREGEYCVTQARSDGALATRCERGGRQTSYCVTQERSGRLVTWCERG
jgi:hypothetical protein